MRITIAVSLILVAGLARGETFTRPQLACALALQQAGARVARVSIARFVRCIDAGSHGRTDAAACLAADPGNRIARARAKTEGVARKRCPEAPPFGPSNAGTVNAALSDAFRTAAVFGTELDAAVVTDRAGGRCQRAVARGLAQLAGARLTAGGACIARLLRTQASPTVDACRACLGTDGGNRVARLGTRIEDRAARACRGVALGDAFRAGCRSDTVAGLLACGASEVQCGACLALDAAGGLGATCDVPGLAPATVCHHVDRDTKTVARQWDEEALAAIRIDLPRPPIHARNLFHLSVAMWDAWAAYDAVASQHSHHERRTSVDPGGDRDATISFAAYRVLKERYALSVNAAKTTEALDARMAALGYDAAYDSTTDDTPAALGNRIAATIIADGLTDGSNEGANYADPTYTPVNAPLVVKNPGTVMVDPNRWQPLALDVQIGQNGIPIPGNIQKYVAPQWGAVTPFALTRPSPMVGYLDPGPPPMLGTATDALFKERIMTMLRLTSQLTIDDGVTIDISPASWGNNPLGTTDGHGYAMNPVTGAPYTPEVVKRGDFTRLLAEFWADGPTSETPPGHWNTIANAVDDNPALVRRVGGTGPTVDPLEWEVKLYLGLNGALHDAAIQCWGTKRIYDSVRPISMIRYMGGLGQSSDPMGPSYHPEGLPLEPGLVEVITPESSAPGQRHAALAAHVGEIAVHSWPGQPADPRTSYSGVQWVRAVDWVPYQRATFVTPAFAAFTSGHSTFSRSAAELLTRFTGSSFFPGGLAEYVIPQNGFLQFEIGPSTEVRLQWAQYYDAADQAGISRLYGGIHTPSDDFNGRRAGAQIGALAWDQARTYFEGAPAP